MSRGRYQEYNKRRKKWETKSRMAHIRRGYSGHIHPTSERKRRKRLKQRRKQLFGFKVP